MSRRYTYSRAITTSEGIETYTAQEFDSFDEAKAAVDKGIKDRLLQLTPATAVKEEAVKEEVKPLEVGEIEDITPDEK